MWIDHTIFQSSRTFPTHSLAISLSVCPIEHSSYSLFGTHGPLFEWIWTIGKDLIRSGREMLLFTLSVARVYCFTRHQPSNYCLINNLSFSSNWQMQIVIYIVYCVTFNDNGVYPYQLSGCNCTCVCMSYCIDIMNHACILPPNVVHRVLINITSRFKIQHNWIRH